MNHGDNFLNGFIFLSFVIKNIAMNCLPPSNKQCGPDAKLNGGVWCGSYSGARYCGNNCVDDVFTVQDANKTLEALRTQRSNWDAGPTAFGVGYVPELMHMNNDRPN